MPRPKKRARSSPRSKQPIEENDDHDEVEVVASAPVRSSRRLTSNQTTNTVNAISSPTRSRRGKRKTDEDGVKLKIEDEVVQDHDDDDDDDEEKVEEVVVVKEEVVEEDIEEEEEEVFECPTCKKRFTSRYGRKYHVDNMVCQPGKRIKKPKIERPAPTTTSFDDDASTTGGRRRRRKSSLRAAKKIMSLVTKSQKSDLDSDDDDADNADGGNSDDEFIAEDGGVKSDDDLVADDDDDDEEEEGVQEPKKKSGGRGRQKSERLSYSVCDLGVRFGVLEKGARFITKFGAVEVIADDRAPEDISNTTCAATPQIVRAFMNRRARFRERYGRVINDIAAGTRYRREELTKLYIASKHTKSSTGTLPILPQEKVWNLYCKSLSLKQILLDGFSSTVEKRGKVEGFTDEDPRFPVHLYPDRIVECKLVEDERECIIVKAAGSFLSTGDEEIGANVLEYNVRERPSASIQIAPMRLYIARNELVQEYDTSTPYFVCKVCGKTSRHREGMKYHFSNNLCWADTNEEKEERTKRIETIESKAMSGTGCRDALLTRQHGIVEEANRGDPMFGNPHRIKEHKKHKMPPWLVFNDQRSSMYPEIYISLGFSRGSQNRNYFNKIKQQDGYVPKPDKNRLRKRLKKVRMLYQSDTLAATTIPMISNAITQSSKTNKRKEAAKKTAKRDKVDLPPSLPPFPFFDTSQHLPSTLPPLPALPPPPALPPFPSIEGYSEMDFGFDYNGVANDNGFDDTPDSIQFNDAPASMDNYESTHESSSTSQSKNSRHRNRVVINKKKPYIVIDTQVLAAECDSGRYPSINRYNGDHDEQCTICNVSDDVPLISCDYCKNSVHQLCLDKKMLGKDPQVIIRENEPDDTPMCHTCISTCMFRRWRAESRRSMKWQQELAKAGLGGAPAAANLNGEINLNDDNLNDGDLDKPTYEPCPDGGPGGLICCSYCTAAYSRFLSNTANEMEAQSVSRVGQEVSEILELLADAKRRLQRASSVSQSNEIRRGLLDINQSAQN